ncbi:MAG: hypothetical protein F4Y79_21530 [Gemmatimonadetes bacterium]|nr:ion channel [Gemmatimonadota bacterium]MXZ12005.1 hypothetical protein [Gemmatimonadota bacterium]MYF17336.1 hypothetical protein [Gemmatimonadota bacterium]
MERSNSRGPDLKFWEHFSTYKYTILALSVVFLFFAMPLLDRAGQDFARFLFLMLLATVLWTLGLPRWLLTLCLVPGIMGFGFHLLIHNIDLSGAVFRVFEMGKMGTYTLFYGICLLIFLHRIFSETTVTIDSIQGGIAIYFLSGVFWAFLYQTLLLFDPDAILFSDHVVGAFSDLIYFSFITMTTLGYGDIMPISRMAKNMAVLEAVWGQTYLAVLVARLVGLHLSGSGRFD